MISETYEVDPDGDLVLVLKKIPEDPDEVDEHTSSEDEKDSDEHPPMDKKATATPGNKVPEQEPDLIEVRIRVSSKHLTLASSFFKALLQRPFKEGLVHQNTGNLEVPLDDSDPEALLITMNIVHGRLHKVPRQVGLFLLTSIAILVDKYVLHETFEFIAEKWINAILKSFAIHQLPWICISWVFGRAAAFKLVTRIAQLERVRSIVEADVDEYPIPDVVVRAINAGRENALSEVVSELHKILGEYQEPTRRCPSTDPEQSFRCDAMVLGALTKELFCIDLLNPPDPPYQGFSIEILEQDLQSMSIPTWCSRDGRSHNNHITFPDKKDQCGIVKERIASLMKRVRNGHPGLDLWELKGQGKKNTDA